jgi:deazaflavin-dependent oxidoreductase (nitroreductase family)
MKLDPPLADEDYCYLTTTGRVTGKPHEVEIWFAAAPERRTIYILAGGRERADFVRNARRTPAVRVRIAGRELAGRARVVEARDEDALARRLLLEKYSPPRYTGGDLDQWGRTALPFAVDLDLGEPRA